MTKLSGRISSKIFSKIKTYLTSHRQYALVKRNPKKTNGKFSNYIILRANKDDYPAILKLMHETFYNEEPTCFSIGLHHNTIMDETSLHKMSEGITVVARCKFDGCIVGAAINESTNPWDPDLKEKLACNVHCPKTKHYLLFQAHVQRSPKLWDCLHVQKIFEITNIFVKPEIKDPQFIAKLIEESRSLAADCGYKIVRVNASTPTIANICENLKMKLISEIPYCSYLGKNLEPIFSPPHPIESFKIFIDENPQKSLTNITKSK